MKLLTFDLNDGKNFKFSKKIHEIVVFYFRVYHMTA